MVAFAWTQGCAACAGESSAAAASLNQLKITFKLGLEVFGYEVRSIFRSTQGPIKRVAGLGLDPTIMRKKLLKVKRQRQLGCVGVFLGWRWEEPLWKRCPAGSWGAVGCPLRRF